MKIILIIILFLTLSNQISFSQSDSFNVKLKTLIELNGGEKAFKSAVNMMLSQFKNSKSNVPEEFWDDFEKEMLTTSIDDLVQLIAPVYNKYLTEKELDDIINFYNTPTGKKFGDLTPSITQETMVAGQEWGMKIGQKIADRLKEEGY